MRALVSLFIFFIVLSCPILADDLPEKLKKPVRESIHIRKKNQVLADQWHLEKAKLLEKYESLRTKNQELLSSRDTLKKDIASCQSRIHDMDLKIKEAARINRELIPFMEETYEKLVRQLKNDAPFLEMKRTGRLTALRETLDKPDIRPCEKFRKLMEVLLIETGYGKTIEVYHERIRIKEKTIMANILRLGRISIFFRSPDHKITGFYNVSESSWNILPRKYNRVISQAFEIGAKRRSADIISMPLGRMAVP